MLKLPHRIFEAIKNKAEQPDNTARNDVMESGTADKLTTVAEDYQKHHAGEFLLWEMTNGSNGMLS